MRRAAHVDLAQGPIVAALRGVGFSVLSLAGVGVRGCPDLLCARSESETFLAEIKTPGLERGYSKQHRAEQEAWRAAWRGRVVVLSSVEEALAVAGVSVQ